MFLSLMLILIKIPKGYIQGEKKLATLVLPWQQKKVSENCDIVLLAGILPENRYFNAVHNLSTVF